MIDWGKDEWQNMLVVIRNSDHDYRPDFILWLSKNKEVWDAFKDFTKNAIKIKHRRRFSARAVMEIVRWYSAVKDENPVFKINNNYIADLSRLIMSQEAAFDGFYQLRSNPTRESGTFKI